MKKCPVCKKKDNIFIEGVCRDCAHRIFIIKKLMNKKVLK